MLQYILNRQTEGKTTTVRDLTKKFKVTVQRVLETLEIGWDGYAVELSEDWENANGSTSVSLEETGTPADEDTGWEEEATEEEEETPTYVAEEDIAKIEPVLDVNWVPGDRYDHTPGAYYPNYTAEEAAKLYPDGWLSLPELLGSEVRARFPEITDSRIIKGFGGNRNQFPLHSPIWALFTINGKPKRYISKLVLTQLEELRTPARELKVKAPKAKKASAE